MCHQQQLTIAKRVCRQVLFQIPTAPSSVAASFLCSGNGASANQGASAGEVLLATRKGRGELLWPAAGVTNLVEISYKRVVFSNARPCKYYKKKNMEI